MPIAVLVFKLGRESLLAQLYSIARGTKHCFNFRSLRALKAKRYWCDGRVRNGALMFGLFICFISRLSATQQVGLIQEPFADGVCVGSGSNDGNAFQVFLATAFPQQ